jgi:ribosomal protein L7Ae-like RNA K-turn-binding protein
MSRSGVPASGGQRQTIAKSAGTGDINRDTGYNKSTAKTIVSRFKVSDRLKKVYNLLGIAQRAGKLSAGTMAAQNSLMRHRAVLLILSEDISDNSREALLSSSNRHGIPTIAIGNKYDLGTALGKAYRVAVTINDIGMAQAIMNELAVSGQEIKSMGVVEWPK